MRDGDDMTYEPVTDVTALRQRVAELESANAELRIGSHAAAIAIDALNSGDLTVRQLADDALAMLHETKHLRAENAELEQSRDFWRTAALDWEVRWEAVPVNALLFWYDPFAPGAALTSESVAQAGAAIDAWVSSVRNGVQDDEPDAPLTLAAIDDEDGDL